MCASSNVVSPAEFYVGVRDPFAAVDSRGTNRLSIGRPSSGVPVFEPFRTALFSLSATICKTLAMENFDDSFLGRAIAIPKWMQLTRNTARNQLKLVDGESIALRFRRVFGCVAEIQMSADVQGEASRLWELSFYYFSFPIRPFAYLLSMGI